MKLPAFGDDLPKTMYICGHEVDVLWVKDKAWDEREDTNGFSHWDFGVIKMRVMDGMSWDTYRTILFHEITHMCWASVGLQQYLRPRHKGEEEQEEYIVYSQSPVIVATLRANPEITDFILGREK